MEKGEDYVAEFPALYLCSVVDSRFASRREIVKDLKGTGLFEKILEPESLDYACTALRSQPVDACIVGPSVSADKAAAFIRSGKEISTAKDCAFLVVRNNGQQEDSQLVQAGAHGILRRPYTKKALNEHVIRSVVKANYNSPWRALALQYFPDLSADFGNSPSSGPASAASESTPPEAKNEVIISSSVLTSVFKAAIPSLCEIVSGHNDGRYTLQIDGNPNSAAIDAIQQLTDRLLQRHALSPEQRHYLAKQLNLLLCDWFADFVLTSEEQATAKLRKKLVAFVTKQYQDLSTASSSAK